MELTSAEIKKFMASIEPFKALAADGLRLLSGKAQARVFSKEQAIFNEGDAADSVWIVYRGRVQIFKYTLQGKPFAVESLGSGELFGTLCRLGGNGREYPCTAVAAGKTLAIQIAEREFVEQYIKSPGLLRGVCALCSDRLKDVQDLRCLGQEPVQVKLANLLLRLTKVHGDTLPFTKKEISELLGVAVETVFRVLSGFQKKGWTASARGKILIKKPQDIASLSSRIS